MEMSRCQRCQCIPTEEVRRRSHGVWALQVVCLRMSWDADQGNSSGRRRDQDGWQWRSGTGCPSQLVVVLANIGGGSGLHCCIVGGDGGPLECICEIEMTQDDDK